MVLMVTVINLTRTVTILLFFVNFFIINIDYLTGNMNDWWDSSTKKLFFKKFDCMIKEYDNFTDPLSNLSSNGTSTLNENIADNGLFLT